MSNIIETLVWNFDIIRQVICAAALGPMVYMIFRREIRAIMEKLNTKTNKEAA
jgi:hypothetical protein